MLLAVCDDMDDRTQIARRPGANGRDRPGPGAAEPQHAGPIRCIRMRTLVHGHLASLSLRRTGCQSGTPYLPLRMPMNSTCPPSVRG